MTTKDEILYTIMTECHSTSHPMNITNIAKKSGISYIYASRLCKGLERSGIIEVDYTTKKGKVYKPNPKYGGLFVDFMRRYRTV